MVFGSEDGCGSNQRQEDRDSSAPYVPLSFLARNGIVQFDGAGGIQSAADHESGGAGGEVIDAALILLGALLDALSALVNLLSMLWGFIRFLFGRTPSFLRPPD